MFYKLDFVESKSKYLKYRIFYFDSWFIVYLILKHTKDDIIFKKIYEFINNTYGGYYTVEDNYGYDFMLSLYNGAGKGGVPRAITNFWVLVYAFTDEFGFYQHFKTNKPYIDYYLLFLNTILENDKILYWSKTNKDNEYKLSYYELKDLIKDCEKLCDYRGSIDDKGYKSLIKTKYIVKRGSYLYLQNENGTVQIDNIRDLPNFPQKNRFKTIYKSLSDALDEKPKEYCPWCNPNEKLLDNKNSRPRKRDVCTEINDYILENLNYSSKYLNDTICQIKCTDKKLKKEQRLKKTIQMRGDKLLEILNLIPPEQYQCDKKLTKKYTDIQNTVKERYYID